MGIQDRDYYRPEGAAGSLSMVATLILINVGAYVANLLLGNQFFGRSLFDWMELSPDVFRQPWKLYELLSYGFAHDPHRLQHLVFNMIGLWCFGVDIEALYGRMEFLRLYLVGVALGGLAFVIPSLVFGHQDGPPMLGASAGILTVVMLFVLNFPQRRILLMGFIPMPAWALGVLFLVMDLSGALNANPGDHTAHGAASGRRGVGLCLLARPLEPRPLAAAAEVGGLPRAPWPEAARP